MRCRTVLSAGWLLCILQCTAGCHTREPLDLLTVHRLEPERASAGDRVAVTGEGFPEGRSATVTFRGALLRPGLPKQTGVRIVARAVPADRGSVAIAFDRSMERRFAGSGSSAVHTTFVGDVEVTFQPGKDGAMPLSGSAAGVRFDVLPPATETPAVEGVDGSPALGFLGLSTTPDPSGRGLAVTGVDADGRAFAAGIRRGDLIVQLDGVSVLSESDLRVRGGERTARMIVERNGRPLPPLAIDVEGLAPLAAADVAEGAALVLFGCLLVLLPATRAGMLLRWLGRLAERRRQARSDSGGGSIARALLPPEGEGREMLAPAILPLLLVLSAFAWLSLGHSLITPDSDLLAIAVGTAGALVLGRALDGALTARAAPFRAFVAALGRGLACTVPAIGAVMGAVVASGRFVMSEMVADQGGAPWRWAGMRNPGLFVLLVLLFASAVPEAAPHGAHAPIEGLPERIPRRPSALRAIVRVVEGAYLWTVCGLIVVLFLGGWRVPGVTAASQEHARVLAALGAALFLVKLWATALAVGAVRRGAGRISVDHAAPIAFRGALPATLAGLVLATGWTAAQDELPAAVGSDFMGYMVVMLTGAICASILAAAVRTRNNVAQVASVNPWL